MTCDTGCQQHCEGVFGRVQVWPTIQHGTRVEFLLHPEFSDPPPYTYRLQVGHTGSNQADDWQTVGLPATGNVTALVDDQQRVFGKTQWTHYRILLDTPEGSYVSEPANCRGSLSLRYWRMLRSRLREWQVQLERNGRGTRGYLLKRRLVGERPEPGQGIIDYLTDDVVNPQSALTVGTEFIDGYYDPIPCVFAELSSLARQEKLDESGNRGQVNDDTVIAGRLLAIPQLDSYDVWVSSLDDTRWVVGKIRHIEEIQGVPIAVEAELRLLPFKHPVYSIRLQ